MKEKTGNDKPYCESKLYVWGVDLDPAEVTSLFGMVPEKTYRRGDLKYPDSPAAAHYVHKGGAWRVCIDDLRKYTLDVTEQIEYWCDTLAQHEDAAKALVAKGYELEVDCYINDGPAVVVDLGLTLLQRLVQLNVNLSLFFVADENQELQKK